MDKSNPSQNSGVWGQLLALAGSAPQAPGAPFPGVNPIPVDPRTGLPLEQPPAAQLPPAQGAPRLDPDKVKRFRDSFNKAL